MVVFLGAGCMVSRGAGWKKILEHVWIWTNSTERLNGIFLGRYSSGLVVYLAF